MNTIHKQTKKANTSWVATADKLPRSLRSVSPAPPCHHILRSAIKRTQMLKLIPTLALSIIFIFFPSCVPTSQSARGVQLMPDGQPRYRKLPIKETAAYQAACRAAFEQLNVRRDIQIKGPVVFRDMADDHIVAEYHLGFISRFVTRFDYGIPPRISETYFEAYDTAKRTKALPTSLKMPKS